VQASCKVILWR